MCSRLLRNSVIRSFSFLLLLLLLAAGTLVACDCLSRQSQYERYERQENQMTSTRWVGIKWLSTTTTAIEKKKKATQASWVHYPRVAAILVTFQVLTAARRSSNRANQWDAILLVCALRNGGDQNYLPYRRRGYSLPDQAPYCCRPSYSWWF